MPLDAEILPAGWPATAELLQEWRYLPDDVAAGVGAGKSRRAIGSDTTRGARMKILLTGFEPFGPHDSNPSERIMEKLREEARSRHPIHLFTAVLPTQYGAAGTQIRRLIRRIRPAAVVCLGLAASRDTISLERAALNLDDDLLPDTAGEVRRVRLILRNGPAAYWSTLPLERMRQALERRGIPSSLSNHAGTYVCNHVFYVARQEIEKIGSRARCGLIHVPGLRRGARAEARRGIRLRRMVEAVECCLGVLCAPRSSTDDPEQSRKS